MKWKKVTVHTTVEAEDLVSLLLTELGVEGVQIENNVPLDEADVKAMYIDILPETEADDGTSRVSFFLHEEEPGNPARAAGEFESGVDEAGTLDNSYVISDRIWSAAEIGELLENVKIGLEGLREYADIGEGRLEIGESQETDWRDKWKEFFHPILIDRILILPGWLEVPEEYKKEVEDGKIKVILIDPGVAFGTGNHETTKLCIPGLVKYVRPGAKVLDLGTGSGILGMAAVKAGAGFVTAVDIDRTCKEVLEENIVMNGIGPDSFRIVIGNALSEDGTSEKIKKDGPYDVAVANILAPVIISLAGPGGAAQYLKKDGVFITSGILDICEQEVLAAFRANPEWKNAESTRMGEWVSVTVFRA